MGTVCHYSLPSCDKLLNLANSPGSAAVAFHTAGNKAAHPYFQGFQHPRELYLSQNVEILQWLYEMNNSFCHSSLESHEDRSYKTIQTYIYSVGEKKFQETCRAEGNSKMIKEIPMLMVHKNTKDMALICVPRKLTKWRRNYDYQLFHGCMHAVYKGRGPQVLFLISYIGKLLWQNE